MQPIKAIIQLHFFINNLESKYIIKVHKNMKTGKINGINPP